MPDQAAIVQELYNRIGSLPPDKAAIVQELARRFNVQSVPDAGAQMRSAALAGMDSSMANRDNVPLVSSSPYPDTSAQAAEARAPVMVNPHGDTSWFDPSRGSTTAISGAAQIANAENAREVAGGAHQVIAGVMDAAKPSLLLGGATAPIATALGLGSGMLAQKGVESGLEALNVPEEYRNLAGDVAGIAAGGAASHGYMKATEPIRDFGLPFMLRDQAGNIVKRAGSAVANLPAAAAAGTIGSVIKPQLDPAETSAVAYGRANNVQMPTSVLTGSKVAANLENIAQNLPLASGVAKTARAAEQSTLAAAGNKEVAGLAPNAGPGPVPEPLDVGTAIQNTAIANEASHSVAADNSYNLLRSIENQPQFKTTVQTGTKLVDGGIDEAGNPISKRVPVMEDVQLPVDYRGFKAAIKPLLADTLRPMSIAQEQSSTGIKAMRNIVDSPDFVSASVADQDLGALKGIIRDSPQAQSVGQAKFAADFLSKQVDAAVERAGPDAVAALKQGRVSTVAKYGAQDFQKSIGFKDVGKTSVQPGEPVGLVDSLMRPGDRSINLLRSVAENTPEHIPALAQSVVQGLLDKVTAEAGMGKPGTALTAFSKLGDETKSTLFGAKTQQLTDFFTLAKKLSENPNPSGSAQVIATLKAAGLVLTPPFLGAPLLIGIKPLTRMLFNPETSRVMQTAMKMPRNSGAAGDLISKQILKAAGSDAVPVPPGTGGVSTTAAASATPLANGSGATSQSGALPGAAGGVAETGARTGGGGRSSDTTVTVAGQPGPGYKAKYKFQELDDVQGSHNGLNFAKNPKYELTNDRRYDNAANQRKIVAYSSRSEFNPRNSINNNPDATSGPMVTDSRRNVLGGNGQKAILDRVYAGNPDGVAKYRALHEAEAPSYGLDPAEARGMRKPVLTREIDDSELPTTAAKQNAITDFNRSVTEALTPAERAIADSRRVSQGTLDDVASRLDAKGEDATLAQVLENKSGLEVLDKLIKDGAIPPQDRAGLADPEQLTPAGKARITSLTVGRFFSDPNQIDTIAPSVRAKVERLAAPLAQIEGKGGAWSLTTPIQDALGILEQSHKLKIANVDDFIKQDGLFGSQNHSPQAVTLANALQSMKPKALLAAVRQYAGDASYAAKGANTLMGDAPTPESSFADAFGGKAAANATNALAEENKKYWYNPKPAANALAGEGSAGGAGITVTERELPSSSGKIPSTLYDAKGGSLQVVKRADGSRSVSDVLVDRDQLRKGVAQSLYLRALEDGPLLDEKTVGENLTPAAAAVRQALVDKGLAKRITDENGRRFLVKAGPANALAPKK